MLRGPSRRVPIIIQPGAAVEHAEVEAARERCTAAKIALNHARVRQREEPNPGHLKNFKAAKADWELAWAHWGRKLDAHPDAESKREWQAERRAQDAIPFIG
jgi:hypothetical protein